MRIELVVLGCFVWLPILDASTNTQFVTNNADIPVLNQDFVNPKVLVDPKTKIIYYLESDGRHISALGADGKLIWTRDPFVDAKLSPYRVRKPLIIYFAFPSEVWWKMYTQLGKADEFISINFNSSQFGVIKKSTGEFIFSGQD